MDDLQTPHLLLRSPQPEDAAPLLAHLLTPEVSRWWHGFDSKRVWDELIVGDDESTKLVIEENGQVAGLIQFSEEDDPDYRHAGIDLFLGPSFQGRGLGEEAIRAVVEHLFNERGHHRLTIDPSADNVRAQRVYEKVGFRRVGTLRDYERGPDGTWHDGLLMELLARDYAPRSA